MTIIHWRNAVSGGFTNATHWKGDVVPGAADDALIDAVGSPYTVTASGDLTVHSLQVGADATLSLTSGRFTALTATGSGENAGVLLIGAGATLLAGAAAGADGTIRNAGTIELNGGGPGERAVLRLDAEGFSLTGGGEIILGGGGGAVIRQGAQSAGIIFNIDNTIVGSGSLRFGQRTRLINRGPGVIDANGAAPLVVHSYLANYGGLVEATGIGGLDIRGSTFRLFYGEILAADGSAVRFTDLPIVAVGTFASMGSGRITASGCGFYDDGGEGLVNAADLTMVDCHLGNHAAPDTISNDGVIHVKGTLEIAALTTLEGPGETRLDGAEVVGVAGGGLTLAGGTISGAGAIGGTGGWALAVAADGAVSNDAGKILTIDTGATVVDNAGTIGSAGPGGVQISSAVNNSGLLIATAGVLSVGSAGAPVTLVNDGTISAAGGTLLVYGVVEGSGVGRIEGGTLDLASTFDQAVKFTGVTGVLELGDSQAFAAAVGGFSRTGKTSLDLGDIGFVSADEASFSGTASSGVLTVTDGTHTANITLIGDYLSATFVAASDGQGGSIVTAATARSAPPLHTFATAMAVLAPRTVESSRQTAHPFDVRIAALALPHVGAS